MKEAYWYLVPALQVREPELDPRLTGTGAETVALELGRWRLGDA